MHNKIYDTKQVFKCLFILVTMVAAMNVTGGFGFAVIIPFALLSLTRNKPEDVFFYILAMVSAIVSNPRIAVRGAAFFIEQRIMLMGFGLLLAARAAGGRRSPLATPFLGMMIYLAYMALVSSTGWQPVVSYLKLTLFTFTYLAFFGAANAAAVNPHVNVTAVRSVILSVAAFFLIGSVALLPFPALGMLDASTLLLEQRENITSLFMGMTSHSQCLGPMVSCLAVIIFCDLIFGVRRLSKFHLMLLLCCPVLIYKTSSRTAMGTFLAGMMFASYFFMVARGVGRRWRGKVLSYIWIGAILAAVAAACSDSIRESALQFIHKRADLEAEAPEMNFETLTSSRMFLVEESLANFRESPVFGNGFQVSRAMATDGTTSAVNFLTAPVEKGVWFAAVLEEGGTIGFVIFTVFLLSVMIRMIRLKAYTTASVFFVLIVSNFGEFTFFSISYLGGFIWALVFASIALDAARLRQDALNRMAMFAPQHQMTWPR